ncbi:hypothetical protein SXCC_04726 [Gluconacetobacter sp. SXCC-1]|nr:hypothetical protein SXCC_04726 [Gluconacetobacter sp. SXCC-1]
MAGTARALRAAERDATGIQAFHQRAQRHAWPSPFPRVPPAVMSLHGAVVKIKGVQCQAYPVRTGRPWPSSITMGGPARPAGAGHGRTAPWMMTGFHDTSSQTIQGGIRRHPCHSRADGPFAVHTDAHGADR